MERTLHEVGQRRSDILDELKTIRKVAELAKRKLSKEENDRVAALLSEDDQLKATQDDLKSVEANLSRIDSLDKELSTSAGRLLPDVGKPVETAPATAIKKFSTLGEQLQAIAYAGQHGDHPMNRDERLQWANHTLAPASGGATAGLPSDGGYLIQKDFASEILKRVYDTGALLTRMRPPIPISSNSNGIKIPAIDETSRASGSRWGGVQMYWGAEADAATAKKPKFRLMELNLKNLIGLAYATDELLADAAAVEMVFQQAFSEELTFFVEDGVINGLGAGTPLGILNCGALVSVSKETGQAATTFVFENALKMWSRMYGPSRSNAVWLINQDVEPQLHSMSAPVGTGGQLVYLPPGGLSQSPYATLFGRPVIPVEYCATLGTVGDVLLVDLSEYVRIEKGGVKADSSIHVRFTTYENTFRYIYRTDGQPTWHSALTPFKGTNTQSPYIACATRS